MKKIIIVAFGILFLTSFSHASAAWNTYPSDCPNPLSIGNYSTGEGIQDGSNGCWTKKSVSASAGQTINIAVFYDNTNNTDANNTTINLNQSPAGSMTSKNSSYSFSGNLSSSAGSLSLSQVTANLSSSETLTFSQAKWFKKTSASGVSLPNGQTGYEAFNGGLSMGTIADGDWGTIIFSFTIGTTTQPQLCQDTSATNYLISFPCVYPQQICTISNFNANPSSITSGNASTLSWNTSNCVSASISSIGNVNTSDSKNVYPTQTKTYTLTAYGSTGGAKTETRTVSVNQLTQSCVINSFIASPTYVTVGDFATLDWDTSNCERVTISNLNYNFPDSGSQTVWPVTNKTYVLTAYDSNGATQTKTRTVYVNNNTPTTNNCSISNFYASDTNIEDGDSTILRWNTNDCNRVKLSSVSGYVTLDGSKTVYPSYDTTYILTAYDDNGVTQTESVRVYVDDVDYDNNDNYCVINSFTATPASVISGNPVTLKWRTTDCNNNIFISSIGTIYSSSGSQIVYPSNSINYVLTAYGSNGIMKTRSVFVTVNQYIAPIISYIAPIIEPIVPVYNNCAVTTVATNINQTVAQLNGIITSPVGANTYFEYGPTVGLGYRTNSRYVNGNTNFTEIVSNLTPNTIYFFRMVSNCQNGTALGAIEVFKTLAIPTANVVTARPIIIQGPTVSNSESPIMLKIENKYQTIKVGDIIDYVVTYKNIGNSKLTNPMVQVFIPQGLTLTNYSRGTYLENERTLSVPIEDLNPDTDGVIYLQARVDSIDSSLAQVVTTAILIYTNPKGAQENAMAYVLNNPAFNNLLGASASASNFLGLNLIGWLLIIILIMLLILIARSLYNRRSVETTTTHKTIN